MDPTSFVERLAADQDRLKVVLRKPNREGLMCLIPTGDLALRAFGVGVKRRGLLIVVVAIIKDNQASGFIIKREVQTVRQYAYRLWAHTSGDLKFRKFLDVEQLNADIEIDPTRAERHIRRRLEAASREVEGLPRPSEFFAALGATGAQIRDASYERRYIQYDVGIDLTTQREPVVRPPAPVFSLPRIPYISKHRRAQMARPAAKGEPVQLPLRHAR